MASDEFQDELSTYELLRLKNVENNRKLLRSLGLIDDTKSPALPKEPKSQFRRRRSRSQLPPTRPKSRRIQELMQKGVSKPGLNQSEWQTPFAKINESLDTNVNNERNNNGLNLKNKTTKSNAELNKHSKVRFSSETNNEANNTKEVKKLLVASEWKKAISLCSKKGRIVRPNHCFCCNSLPAKP